jgi:hypothetical protein
MGGSAGMLVVLPLAQIFLETYGWSMGYVAMALLSLLILVAAIFLRAAPKGGPTVAAVANLTIGEALRQAFKHRS